MRRRMIVSTVVAAVLLVATQMLAVDLGTIATAQVEQPPYGDGAGATGAQQLPQTGGDRAHAPIEQPDYGNGAGATGAQRLPQTGGEFAVRGSPTMLAPLGAVGLLIAVAGAIRARRRPTCTGGIEGRSANGGTRH